MLEDVLKEYGCSPAEPMDVYTDLFHLGEGMIEREGELTDGQYKSNPILYYKTEDGKNRHRILFEDTFENELAFASEQACAYISGCTYFGKRNRAELANKMCGIIIDLDGVTEKTCTALCSQVLNVFEIPPNYISLSGHGLHLYYVFEDPYILYPNNRAELKQFKYHLTRRLWNLYTSTIEEPQYQGIYQGFRAIGSKTKIPGKMVTAYRMNDHPWTLDALMRGVPDADPIPTAYMTPTMSKEEAREKYPEWFSRHFTEDGRHRPYVAKQKRFISHPGLYEWWLRTILEKATPGHRYFCCMCLAVYGVKCQIDEERVRADAYSLIEPFTALNPEEPFTAVDVESALECYDDAYVTFPRESISKICAIPIQSAKRNGRRQADHIKLMNYIRDELNGNTNWRNGNGRKSKEKLVKEWQEKNPNGRKIDCERETGLSRHTVLKWWKGE